MKHIAINDQDHRRGDAKAATTLVEYGDYQCPYCADAFPLIESTLTKAGQSVQFVFRNFPLVQSHPLAMAAAITAEAAARQGKFWEMHRLLFQNQKLFRSSSPHAFAEQLGLSLDQFDKDVQAEEIKKKIEMDFSSGMRAGVNGTPAFFVNGERFTGNWAGDELLTRLMPPNHSSRF